MVSLTSIDMFAQNPLNIPPVLTGSSFNLKIQSGSQNFYSGKNTPTLGINSVWMAPTIIVYKGDSVTLNVKNTLNIKTTMHWHGLHVAAFNDGGPHQIIQPSATWSPSFKIRNNAATYWYHPHGAGQTDPQVSKGLSGFLIVKDSQEAALNLPRTYGIDDIPLNIQSKAFDDLQQIAIATESDTAIFINGTLHAYFNSPAQVIRFRLLNGSSLRTYNLGLSNGQKFYQIATDGGMLDSSIVLTRLILSPGERAEILINFAGLSGQTIYLKSYASELPKGIYGANQIGMGKDTIAEYGTNFLNGSDFNLMELRIVAQTTNPITTVPTALIPFIPLNKNFVTNSRTIEFDTIRLLQNDLPNLSEGPFAMNKRSFDMDSINEVIYLNTTEIWTLVNNTLVAHPFHIHDVQFNIIKKNGMEPSSSEKGWKDVVLVMPKDSVKFITRFEDFANNKVPYMYHCHLLHHEDDGMMGSFLVIDTARLTSIKNIQKSTMKIEAFPNPSNNIWTIDGSAPNKIILVEVFNILGKSIFSLSPSQQSNKISFNISNEELPCGMYFLKLTSLTTSQTIHLIKI